METMLKKTETLGPDGVEYYYSDPHKDSIGQTATTTTTQQTTVEFHLTNKQTNEHDTKIFFLSRYCLFADTPETLLTLSKSKAETKVPGARQKAFFQITAINTFWSNNINFSLLACISNLAYRPQAESRINFPHTRQHAIHLLSKLKITQLRNIILVNKIKKAVHINTHALTTNIQIV
ncbi:conserved hypothetical protein [Trichinella spiralis]|uniref:hypothetical protein n=1 Tax=Trichinella spiralis TaxID=6334 RepID=UPI0001EFBEC7|nr:conserved hypothetical protein [Trichinella spiralis]